MGYRETNQFLLVTRSKRRLVLNHLDERSITDEMQPGITLKRSGQKPTLGKNLKTIANSNHPDTPLRSPDQSLRTGVLAAKAPARR